MASFLNCWQQAVPSFSQSLRYWRTPFLYLAHAQVRLPLSVSPIVGPLPGPLRFWMPAHSSRRAEFKNRPQDPPPTHAVCFRDRKAPFPPLLDFSVLPPNVQVTHSYQEICFNLPPVELTLQTKRFCCSHNSRRHCFIWNILKVKLPWT